MTHTIGIIGFGEVGGIFGRALKGQAGVSAVHAWDIKFAGAAGRSAHDAAVRDGIVAESGMQALCDRANLLISAVTASHTLEVAEEAARHVRAGTLFLDLNSASPGTKQRAAALLEAAGARYVEAGVMSSVPPYGIKVPILLGGPHAEALGVTLAGWRMDVKTVSARLGVASAIKMSRSIMIKGMEALVIEAYTNARRYGVEEHVLPTLRETFPQIDWSAQGAYFFSRVVQHGKRRAEEMREAALTVQETGIAPLMTAAIADKQQWVAELGRDGVFEGLAKSSPWQDYADRIIDRSAKDAG